MLVIPIAYMLLMLVHCDMYCMFADNGTWRTQTPAGSTIFQVFGPQQFYGQTNANDKGC